MTTEGGVKLGQLKTFSSDFIRRPGDDLLFEALLPHLVASVYSVNLKGVAIRFELEPLDIDSLLNEAHELLLQPVEDRATVSAKIASAAPRDQGALGTGGKPKLDPRPKSAASYKKKMVEAFKRAFGGDCILPGDDACEFLPPWKS